MMTYVSSESLAQKQKKKKIAVLNFVNAGGLDKNEISILTDQFSHYLDNTEAYDVLEREKMDVIWKEKNFTVTDNCNSAECAAQAGHILGTDYMIVGKIGKLGTIYSLDIKMIDVTTRKVINTQCEKYEGKKEGLFNLIERLTYAISAKTATVEATTKTTTAGKDTKTGAGSGTTKTGTATGATTTEDDDDEMKIGTVTKTDKVKKFGSLEINSEVDGILYINDKKIGEVTEGMIIPIEKIKVGEHTITMVYSDGEFSETVVIEFNQKTKLTLNNPIGSFKDPRDGKVYKTIKIGNQVWLAQNLNYDIGSGTLCYEDNRFNCDKYGRLYTWEAAKKAVPQGWRLPSKEDFKKLLDYLDKQGDRYQQFISRSGFKPLFGGWCRTDGKFFDIGTGATFWSSTEIEMHHAWYLSVSSNEQKVDMGAFYYKHNRFSVRLITD